MIKSKIEGSVSNDLGGSIYSDRLGSVSSGQVGSVSTEFPVNIRNSKKLSLFHEFLAYINN